MVNDAAVTPHSRSAGILPASRHYGDRALSSVRLAHSLSEVQRQAPGYSGSEALCSGSSTLVQMVLRPRRDTPMKPRSLRVSPSSRALQR